MDRKKLLITNDDGVDADGLKVLVDALKGKFALTVVAPLHERSGASMSMTVRDPIQVKRVDTFSAGVDAFSVNGTPTDCIKLALSGGFTQKPDLIVSGINPGTNAGRNVLYSGTVGAAIQGVLAGIQSVAFSMYSFEKPNYLPALPHIEKITSHLIANPLPEGTLLNVNFPSIVPYQGIKWTRQGRGVWKEAPHTQHDISSGEALYWLGHKEHLPEEEDSDTIWLSKGYITLVPVKIGELTDFHLLKQRQHIDLQFSTTQKIAP